MRGESQRPARERVIFILPFPKLEKQTSFQRHNLPTPSPSPPPASSLVCSRPELGVGSLLPVPLGKSPFSWGDEKSFPLGN